MKDKKKKIMPDYRYMHVHLNQCLRQNMSKALFSVLLYFGITAFIYSVALFPSVMLSEESVSINSIACNVLSIILVILCTVVKNMMNYDLNAMVTNMVNKDYVTMGFLFIAFRDKSKRALKSSLIFTGIYIVVSLAVCAGFFILSDNIFTQDLSQKELYGKMMMTACVLIFVLFIFISPFIFVNIILHSQKNLKVRDAFRLSFKMMMTHYFHAIGFALYAGGKDLIVLIVCNVISIFIPSGDETSIYATISMLLSFIAFVAEYKAIVRIYVAVPIYYYSLVGIIKGEQNRENDDKTPLLLIEDSGRE